MRDVEQLLKEDFFFGMARARRGRQTRVVDRGQILRRVEIGVNFVTCNVRRWLICSGFTSH